MKGHLEIELKDINTGKVEKHEDDNMVTDAIANILGLSFFGGISYSSSSSYRLPYYVLPIAQKALGGLMMFDGTLEESKDNIHFPTDVHLTGCAGRKANTESKLIGSYNSVESHRNDNGFTSVWDFTTSQANGTIASLSLTNYLFGENPFGGIFQSGDKIDTTTIYQPIAYDPNKEILYLNGSGKIYAKKMYSPIIHVNSPDFTTEELVFDFNFTNPSFNYWEICNGYDGYLYAIYTPSSVSTKKTINFTIRKVKISDFSFKDEGEQTISIANATCNSTSSPGYTLNASHCVSRGYLYFTSYDGYSLFKVNLSNVVDVKEFVFGDEISVKTIYPLYNGGVFATNVFFYKYSSSGSKTKYCATGWITSDGKLTYNEQSTYSTGSDYDTNSFCNLEGDNLFVVQSNSSNYLNYGIMKNYLGTICNLSSPVVKTSAQTMKVTYTLTDE